MPKDKGSLAADAGLELKSVCTGASTARTKEGATVGQGAFTMKNTGQSETVAPITVIPVDMSLGHLPRFEKAFGTAYCLEEKNATFRATMMMMANTPTMYVNDPRGLTINGLAASINCTLKSLGHGKFALVAARPLPKVR